MAEILIKDQKRKPWIDALRAMALFFVIYGHLFNQYDPYFIFTSPVKIPLFFVISGYLFNPRDGKVKPFLEYLLTRLIVPWLVLTLGVQLLFIPFRGFNSWLIYAGQVLTGKAAWYLPCFILAETLLFFMHKWCKKFWQICACCALACVCGLVLAEFGLLKIFKINTAFTVQVYLLLGMLLRRYEHRAFKLIYGIAALAVYIGLCVMSMHFFPEEALDVNENYYYGQFPLCLAMVVAGCFGLFACASQWSRYPRLISFIGQNTLVLYLLESPVKMVLFKIAAIFGLRMKLTWYTALLWLAMVVGCGCVAVLVLNWVFPAVLGRRRTVKTVK